MPLPTAAPVATARKSAPACRLVVLDHGQVVGPGTHSELVVSTPLYRDLAKHQLL